MYVWQIMSHIHSYIFPLLQKENFVKIFSVRMVFLVIAKPQGMANVSVYNFSYKPDKINTQI